MSHTVRVTFDDEVWEVMQDVAPAAIQDPEVVRMLVSYGLFSMTHSVHIPTRERIDVEDLLELNTGSRGLTPSAISDDESEEESDPDE
jgi:uncharacterized Zn finger protein